MRRRGIFVNRMGQACNEENDTLVTTYIPEKNDPLA